MRAGHESAPGIITGASNRPATNTIRAHICIKMGENPEFNHILPNTDYEKLVADVCISDIGTD